MQIRIVRLIYYHTHVRMHSHIYPRVYFSPEKKYYVPIRKRHTQKNPFELKLMPSCGVYEAVTTRFEYPAHRKLNTNNVKSRIHRTGQGGKNSQKTI